MSSFRLSNPEQEAKEYLPHFKWLYAIITCIFVIIFCRLWYLQVVQGSVLRTFSERNRIKETSIAAPRGVILDRGGSVLVDNLPGFEAVITPQYASNLKETAQVIERLLSIPAKNTLKKVKRSRRQNGPFFPVRIQDNLTREEVFRLKLIRLDHPGLEIRQTIVRHYPLESNGAQLFGYVGEISKRQLPIINKKLPEDFPKLSQGDIIGKSGLEETYDQQLRGQTGVSFLEVDARGRELSKGNANVAQVFGKMDRFRPAQPGSNLQLTIDIDVQKAAFESFKRLDRIGSLVAVTPEGEIVAWLNNPSYNPNDFSTGISSRLWKKLVNDPFHPLRNKVIQDHHSPGSTFKPVVAIAGLEEKVITPQTTYRCGGSMRFGRRSYHCWLRGGHGNVNLRQAIEQSCNIFFYKLGSALGIDKIAKYASALGIGNRTGIKLFNEVPGLMPDTHWKIENRGEEWQPGENLSNAIGQGFILTTPLQMALAYSAIATHGKLAKPRLIRKMIDSQGAVLSKTQPEWAKDLGLKNLEKAPEKTATPPTSFENLKISKSTFDEVKEGMRLVANGKKGTARYWKIPGVEIAGKTGTGQLLSFSADQIYSECKERPIHQRHHGWFVGYAPADNPVLTVAVLAEHSCSGSSGAAPIVRDVLKAYLEKHYPEKLKTVKTRKVSSE